MDNEKCVMILDEALPSGVIANTAGILGITLGQHIPVGCDVADASGKIHRGIIEFPVPVLRAAKEKIRAIREALYQPDYADLIVVDFSDVAQSCKTYDEFIEKAARAEEDDWTYLGVAICGAKKLVNKLTGNLPLLR